jgi:plasmid maintenance system antidote protein VapI
MKLKKYLEIYEITQGQAAKELNITRTYLNAIVNNKEEPGRNLVEKIVKWTDNEVRSDDLPGWKDFK